jgi:hypothetical protein
MTADEFVPAGFDPPTSLATDQFHLEPLGPQHNQADHAAWMSSIEHIRSTPGFPDDGNWPPGTGMTLEENLADVCRDADDFTRGAGYTFTVSLGHRGVGCHGAVVGAGRQIGTRRPARRRRRTLARYRLAMDARGPLRSLSRDPRSCRDDGRWLCQAAHFRPAFT